LVSRDYLACAIRSQTIQTHFKNVARGVAVKGVNIGDVKPTPIPIPPLAEQHQIVAEVEARTTAIDHLEAELDRQITRSNRLRQSILASAFAG
jgi:type I restriction enzyme S subunit